MPPLEQSDRFQDAVLWPKTGSDSYGQPTVGDPVQLRVRWSGTKRLMVDKDGHNIAIDAEVVVDRTIENGSVMWLGLMEDLPGTALCPETDVYEVKAFKDTPDVKGRNHYRIVSLMRLKGVLPKVIPHGG